MFSLSQFNNRDKTPNSSNEQTNKLDPQKVVADKNVTEKAHTFCCYEIKRSLKWKNKSLSLIISLITVIRKCNIKTFCTLF